MENETNVFKKSNFIILEKNINEIIKYKTIF